MKQMVRLVCGLLGVGLQVVAGDLAAQTLHEAAVKGVEPTVIQQIVQQRVCTQSHALQASSPSAAGSLAGAVVGGAIGNAVSHGTGQAAATVLGAIAGAAVAQQSESKQVVAIPVENCVLQPVQVSIQAFKVRFEWQGKDYEAILAHQPGQSITLQVSDVGANGSPTICWNTASKHNGQPTNPSERSSTFKWLYVCIPLRLPSRRFICSSLCLSLRSRFLPAGLFWLARLLRWRPSLAVTQL
ncbi:MAG: glycine zipper 2TM domain-containing protein [Betaproteobacteria bacterium]|nr:glycine zipper 2TM domain-containing protein [Betaproteobacteria bacterium]